MIIELKYYTQFDFYEKHVKDARMYESLNIKKKMMNLKKTLSSIKRIRTDIYIGKKNNNKKFSFTKRKQTFTITMVQY